MRIAECTKEENNNCTIMDATGSSACTSREAMTSMASITKDDKTKNEQVFSRQGPSSIIVTP